MKVAKDWDRFPIAIVAVAAGIHAEMYGGMYVCTGVCRGANGRSRAAMIELSVNYCGVVVG